MDTLQSDINALEADKARLNERIKDLSKSNLLLQAEAYKLAGELKTGKECPVCGSVARSR